MKMPGLNDREIRDAMQVMAVFLLIILTSLIQLAAATLIIGIFVVGLLMIFDSSYLPLFDQWLVAVILFIVYRIAVATRRSFDQPTVMTVVMPSYPHYEHEDGYEGDAWPRPRPPVLNQPQLPLIGHGH